jgi:hypothetical protein
MEDEMTIENNTNTHTNSTTRTMTKDEFCRAFDKSWDADDDDRFELWFIESPDQPDFEPYWKVVDGFSSSDFKGILEDDLDFDASVRAFRSGARGLSMLVPKEGRAF